MLRIIIRTARGLAYIHARNILHQDLKPGNLMLQSVSPPVVKIIDFGLAALREFRAFTNPVHITGTFSYMSPEQTGIIKRESDERSD